VFLFLFLFFCLQVIDSTMKEGVQAGVVLAFTSIVIFPIVCVLEIVGRRPHKPEDTQNDLDEFVMSAKEMLIFDGIVYHERKEQAANSFSYHIQCALINLDSTPDDFTGGPPPSPLTPVFRFTPQSLKCARADHLTADEARVMAGTDGPVLLLTTPASAGYHQNPISIYYCFAATGDLPMCLAEVSNTPWGERTTFPFVPTGDAVPKPFHVRSPPPLHPSPPLLLPLLPLPPLLLPPLLLLPPPPPLLPLLPLPLLLLLPPPPPPVA
jgi:hypothetical protein